MKIFAIGIMAGDNPPDGWEVALRKIAGTENVRVLKPHKGMDEKVLQIYSEFKPDLIFMQIQSEGIISAELCAFMDKSFIINWTGDVRNGVPRWMKEIAPVIDLTTFVNKDDVAEMQAAGFKSDFLEIGFDPTIYTPEGTRGTYPEIIFCANNYPNHFPLSNMRRDMVLFLKKEYGNRFQVYGNGWQGEGIQTRWLTQRQEAEAYRSCKIAINLSHYDNYTSDRILRIMGAGAFCLSHKYKYLTEDYERGLLCWSDFDELKNMIDKIFEFLPVDDIAKSGCNFVHKNHTFDKMIENIILLYEKYK